MHDGPVLVVGDDPEFASMLSEVLTLLDISSEVVRDGEAAIRAVQQVRPSLVLLDLFRPGSDAVRVASTVKADPASRSVPVICVGVRSGTEDVEQVLQAGCDDYVPEPFDIQRLEDTIRKYLPQGRVEDASGGAVNPPLIAPVLPSPSWSPPAAG